MSVRRTTKDFGRLFGLPQLCQYVPDVVWGPSGISVRRGSKTLFPLFCYHMTAGNCSILWWNNTAVFPTTILHFIGQSIMALTFPVYSIFLPRGLLNVKDSFVLKNLLIWHLTGDIDIDTMAPNNVWQMSLVSEQALPYMGMTAPAMATLLSTSSL